MSATRHKTALITGASSGIGRSTSLYLARKGYSVIGTSRSMARLADLQAEASGEDLSVAAVELDINRDEDVARVVPGLVDEYGAIDVLVNNAGYGLWGPVECLALEEVRTQFEVNFFAALRLIKAVLPGMMRNRRGWIVNVSSVLGRIGTPFNGAYVASKFALEGMSESLRTELWPFGIRVAVVEPGLFDTNFQANQVAGEATSSPDLAYSPYLTRYRAGHGRFDRLASDPIKVARAIHKIARSRRPAFRHPVGVEARLGTLGSRFMPERLFQAMVRKATMG